MDPAVRETETREALWYKDAIIYQMHVRAFRDSDGDGIGDFRGLTERLDYIQDLGVTTIWLLPFYPSPLRDDGYDIADYSTINPIYGELGDFQALLKEAHDRGLKVVTELVINHTSDQHAWFQAARRAKPGDPARDFYVWSDTDQKYRDARIIFQDFETSNWTWDPVAGAYYWHRFYSHQPDLNFDHPPVHDALARALDFWLAMGVDGLRLDAIPYLFEREGTSCENLPETHAYLKKLRKHVDERFTNRMLLAEANQWPEEAVNYFGDGDECHMAFHFPVMPRLYMAVQREDRTPIVDILQQTPAIPENCQWSIFLRNHDELTLEMVTDEERAYMYRAYADDPRARVNLGIRRRLAPLLGNNRRKLELMNGLLLSLPGSPVIYYGDEIGMGDNIYLGDRNGVRTPMQWNADRNAGFSMANPQRLFLPVITDPEFHYTAVNVETQQNNPHSLLWWMKRLIALRKRHQAFSRGDLEVLHPENPRVFAFLRRYEDETLLIIANLSRFVQCVELDLAKYAGMAPVELFGRTRFPPIGEWPYFITLGPHAFYWFRLHGKDQATIRQEERPVKVVRLGGGWQRLFEGNNRLSLESALGSFLVEQPWYRAQGRIVQKIELEEALRLEEAAGHPEFRILLVRVNFIEGEGETYVVPVEYAPVPAAVDDILHFHRKRVICAIHDRADTLQGVLFDAGDRKELWTALLDFVGGRQRIKGVRGDLSSAATSVFDELRGDPQTPLEPHILRMPMAHSASAAGEKLFIKLLRRIETGPHPEVEISRYLTEEQPLPHVPRLAGSISYRGKAANDAAVIGIVEEFRENSNRAWEMAIDEMGRYYEEIRAEHHAAELATVTNQPLSLFARMQLDPPPLALATIGAALQGTALLGKRTAELHRALGATPGHPVFSPEPFTPFYRRSLLQSYRNRVRRVLPLLKQHQAGLPAEAAADAASLLDSESAMLAQFQAVVDLKIQAQRIRCHGDYDLRQLLFTGQDFVIIDFEGNPNRALSERRIKGTPFRDLASLLYSFQQAAQAALLGLVLGTEPIRPEDVPALSGWRRFWYDWAAASCVKAYLAEMEPTGLLPPTAEGQQALLKACLLDRILQDLEVALVNRPEWIRIPLTAARELLEEAALP